MKPIDGLASQLLEVEMASCIGSGRKIGEQPRIFQFMGANQNARKLLFTYLVNTKCTYPLDSDLSGG